MLIAEKGNRTFVIEEAEIEDMVIRGFDILKDNGKGSRELIKHGAGKTVPYALYKELQDKLEALEKPKRTKASAAD